MRDFVINLCIKLFFFLLGTVTTEARIDPETGGETQGRISYENRGECFFLPFTMSDVEGNVTVAAGDKVSFQVGYFL